MPGKSPFFIYFDAAGEELERTPCAGKSVDQLTKELAERGIVTTAEKRFGKKGAGGADDEKDEM